MAIKIDPWKRIDQDYVFDEPENVYIVDGNVNLPWNIKCEFFRPNLYDPAQIKRVLMLENVVEKIQQVTLSVQYNHCLVIASLNTGRF